MTISTISIHWTQTQTYLSFVIIVSFLGCTVTGCSAHRQSDKILKETDCVGSVQISLPSYSDFSSHSFSTLLSNLKVGEQQPNTHFPDNQEDGYTLFDWHGQMLISHPVNSEQKKLLIEAKQLSRTDAQKYNQEYPTNSSKISRKFAFIDLPDNNMLGWQVNGAYSVIRFVNDAAVMWSGLDDEPDVQTEASRQGVYLKHLSSAQSRSFGDLPRKVGLCFPYIFLPSDPKPNNHAVAVAYRPQSHPDIVIWLKETSVSLSKPDHSESPTAAYDNQLFWRARYSDYQKLHLLFHDDIRLAGIKGESSFVELTRDDNTIDYGFFAAARMDSNQGREFTGLQMFVIRDAKNAIAKGIKPMEKDEFLKLAQAVAASIKKRPTTPP